MRKEKEMREKGKREREGGREGGEIFGKGRQNYKFPYMVKVVNIPSMTLNIATIIIILLMFTPHMHVQQGVK